MKTSKSISWLDIESVIKTEIFWLKSHIRPFKINSNLLNYSDNEVYRNIAIQIVSGKVKATEVGYLFENVDFYKNFKKMHGSAWHDNTMKYFKKYFIGLGYDIIDEPSLFYGRADLAVVGSRKKCIIEIGTINLMKLWLNLVNMKDVVLIIVTNKTVIKFEI